MKFTLLEAFVLMASLAMLFASVGYSIRRSQWPPPTVIKATPEEQRAIEERRAKARAERLTTNNR